MTSAPVGPLAAFTGTFRGSGFNLTLEPTEAGSRPEFVIVVKTQRRRSRDALADDHPIRGRLLSQRD